jgi:hypothetical protein
MIPLKREVWDAVEYTAWKQVDNQLAILFNSAFDEVSLQVKSQIKEPVYDQMMSKMR